MLFPFKPNFRVCLVSFISILLYCFWKQKRSSGKRWKKNCGKRDFLENSLHNRRFMSQARRRLLLALRAEYGMLHSTHLAFIKRLLCKLLEKKKKEKKRECAIRYPPFPCHVLTTVTRIIAHRLSWHLPVDQHDVCRWTSYCCGFNCQRSASSHEVSELYWTLLLYVVTIVFSCASRLNTSVYLLSSLYRVILLNPWNR